jgi:hypothetical protein
MIKRPLKVGNYIKIIKIIKSEKDEYDEAKECLGKSYKIIDIVKKDKFGIVTEVTSFNIKEVEKITKKQYEMNKIIEEL